MQQAAFKLVDLHPGSQQFGKEGAAGPAHQQRVVLARQDDADIDAALGGGADGMQKIVTGHKVGSRHDQMLFGRVGGSEQSLMDQIFRKARARGDSVNRVPAGLFERHNVRVRRRR